MLLQNFDPLQIESQTLQQTENTSILNNIKDTNIIEVPMMPDIDHYNLTLNRTEKDDEDYIYADKYTVLNPICKILFPSSIYLLHHHKTGTFLSKKLRRIIAEYCNISYSEHVQKIYDGFAGFLTFRENLSDHDISSVVMDFVRDPVLTIISGFKYHMHQEGWTALPLKAEKLELASFYDGVTDLPKLADV